MLPISPDCQLPIELVNLLALQSSFLTALALHYAHNGTATPVDLRELTASVSSVWRQRQVTYDDIRLCLGVMGSGPSGSNNPFYLSDYGRGKICLEIQDEHKMAQGSTMNEEALQLNFQENLDYLWKQYVTSQVPAMQKANARPIATPKKRGRPRKADAKQSSIKTFVDATAMPQFISQLPLSDITTCASLTAVAPLQERGRKRLREFKESAQQGRAPKKARETTGKENVPAQTQAQQAQPAQGKITDFASVRKTNLLDRILAKQAAAVSGPAAPSPAVLQRKAALARAEEVLGVLSLLCASKPGSRVSFSMTSFIQALQGSIRSPISRDEALKCVEVLANEVTPGYVSVVKMGTISSVVVNRAMRPMDVKSRVAALGEMDVGA